MAVAAVSSDLRRDELVDITYLGRAGSYFGLNLPAGNYQLLVLADLDDDGTFRGDELVGSRALALSAKAFPQKVASDVDLRLGTPEPIARGLVPIRVPASAPRPESLFFPKGTLRTLDDAVFDPAMSELGVYDPAAFMEAAPLMFYALEDDLDYKIPVIFVHGMAGSARQFRSIVQRLDRQRYKPWFFHYPSGMDLKQLAQLFYDIFLSGTVIPKSPMPNVIVAHSMGGLVVREAMNEYGAAHERARVDAVITIASPFAGDPNAQRGLDRSPIVVPAWRDLAPTSRFVTELFRTPLPSPVAFHVMYTYLDEAQLAHGHGSDGVVSVSSQLPSWARAQFTTTRGFQSGHAEVLEQGAAVQHIIALVQQVKSVLPEEHMRQYLRGGFDVPLGSAYSEVEKYELRQYGWELRALANGEVTPILPAQQHFVRANVGTAEPLNECETAWQKFKSDYPALATTGP